MNLIFYAAIGVTSFSLVAVLLVWLSMRPSRADRRVKRVLENQEPSRPEPGARQTLALTLIGAAGKVRKGLGLSGDDRLKQRLLAAGLRRPGSVDVYLASRFLGPLMGVVAGSFIAANRTFCMFLFAVLGYLAPDLWLGWKVSRRQERIRKSIPDAVDLLVICVDAGLGLDQALMRVGKELSISHPDIHHEFSQINLEQRAGKPRLEAWQSMADRTKLAEFNAFVSMLTQTDKFGTPIVRALSRYADEIRLKRRQRAEEQASKTKIKILFPLVLFIFPCLFIVLLAPAVIGITKGLGTLGK